METLENLTVTFSNPFVVSLALIFVISLIIIFAYKPQVGRKTFFRNTLYVWIVTMAIIYLHHRSLENDYDTKLRTSSNISTIARQVGAFEEIEPIIHGGAAPIDGPVDLYGTRTANPSTEDDLI